jgi:hypothetical protein
MEMLRYGSDVVRESVQIGQQRMGSTLCRNERPPPVQFAALISRRVDLVPDF